MADNIQNFDFSVNLLQAILWQYNDAENYQAILQNEQNFYTENQRDFWRNWYIDVFNLETANDFGCSVWAVILGIPLAIIIGSDLNQNPYGYGAYRKNFENGNFVNTTGFAARLTLEQKRLVLRLRYYQLTSRCTLPEINAMLQELFGNLGGAYVLDGLDMTMTYVFRFQPDYDLDFVLNFLDLLPRPAGVKMNRIVIGNKAFGFEGFRLNYNNGNFGE